MILCFGLRPQINLDYSTIQKSVE
uniref:Uncharacterized protein n=1 Tax=Anguilla anguilla TaxID=7936 RepID=A0A0E9PLN4_ANGAN